jgi:predicted nucleic acid-binding protein
VIHPENGPFLFDTSAESWFARSQSAAAQDWLKRYLTIHPMNVSAAGVIERIRGYRMLWQGAPEFQRPAIDALRWTYLDRLARVLAVDRETAVAAGEIMAWAPTPPSPPRRTHRIAESRQDRLARWRFDCIIAATALVAQIPLLHNNAADFELVRAIINAMPDGVFGSTPLRLIDCSHLL